MTTDNRPLSPHLQIYKPQLTSVLSITHRGTGIFLSLGALFFSCWLMAIANGPDAYNGVQPHITSWYGQVFLFLFVFSLYYHLCNGIRHLFWDIGLGFELRTTYLSGYSVIAATLVLTALTWYFAGAIA